jgi:hypothetical protein
MTFAELAADFVSRNAEILKMTLSDFSDADMLARPAPGANHAAWQIGHLVGATWHMYNAVAPGVVPAALAAYAEKHTGKTANVDDPAHYGTKAQLLEAFAQAHAAVVEWARHLKPEDFDKPTTERLANFAPTIGHLVLMTGSHASMHVGQMQVIRRFLGKPLLF